MRPCGYTLSFGVRPVAICYAPLCWLPKCLTCSSLVLPSHKLYLCPQVYRNFSAETKSAKGFNPDCSTGKAAGVHLFVSASRHNASRTTVVVDPSLLPDHRGMSAMLIPVTQQRYHKRQCCICAGQVDTCTALCPQGSSLPKGGLQW